MTTRLELRLIIVHAQPIPATHQFLRCCGAARQTCRSLRPRKQLGDVFTVRGTKSEFAAAAPKSASKRYLISELTSTTAPAGSLSNRRRWPYGRSFGCSIISASMASNRSHKKRRFVPSRLDDLLNRIEQNTTTRKAVSNADYCSIPEACFQYGPTTAQVTRLLIGSQLPSSVQLEEKRGFDGVRIRRDELLAAMRIFADDHISPRHLSRRLGLSFAELRTLRELQLLPSFPPPKRDHHRSIKCISQIVLRRFLERYQTVTTAARHLSAVQAKIKLAAIKPAREGKGLPIFYRADLLG